MKISVLFFGQLTDLTGTHSLELENIEDTSGLTRALHQQFPGLAHKKYVIAVDKKMMDDQTLLTENCTVALLPPFSGG